jgi:hypothetical protein
MIRKLIIMVIFGVILFADYVKEESLVRSNNYGLIWQDNEDTETMLLEWIEAINYCDTLALKGYMDWRLPNTNELISLVSYDRHGPAIDSAFAYIDQNASYWTSTTHERYLSDAYYAKAWLVDFSSGMQLIADKGSEYHVRCVRNR